MATVKISFRPTTSGIHHVGHKTVYDADFIIEDIDVPQNRINTVIDVNIHYGGNLYCESSGVDMDWYIIPDCMSQVDSNSDGIPDLAISGTYTIPNVQDPWQYAKISLTGDIDLTQFACNGSIVLTGSSTISLNGIPIRTFIPSDYVSSDPGINVEFQPDYYRCQANKSYEIDSTLATTGEGKLMFYSAWDGSGDYEPGKLVIMSIVPGNIITLHNVINYVVLDGTLDVTPTVNPL